MIFRQLFIALWLVSYTAYPAEIPGGLIRTAEPVKADTAELLLSPSYVMSPTGAYLSSEFRYQSNEDFSVGAGFGAGEVGFNIGGFATWYIIPDLQNQPGFALTGGLYFNRLRPFSYFNLKLAPTVSKTVKMEWGNLTPYAGLHITPSFRLSEPPANELSLKTSLGSAFAPKSLNGLRFWAEADLGLANSVHEVVVGVTYPLNNL